MEDKDILSIIQASARSGTLLSSCQPEVKELMHQLDVLISGRCEEWKKEVARMKALLEKKDADLQALQAQLSHKIEEVENAERCREREHRARCADYEAQLMRLRSQVTSISRNYERLTSKHHQLKTKNFEGLNFTKMNLAPNHLADYERKKNSAVLIELQRTIEKAVMEESNDFATETPPLLEMDQLLQQLLDKNLEQLKLELQMRTYTS